MAGDSRMCGFILFGDARGNAILDCLSCDTANSRTHDVPRVCEPPCLSAISQSPSMTEMMPLWCPGITQQIETALREQKANQLGRRLPLASNPVHGDKNLDFGDPEGRAPSHWKVSKATCIPASRQVPRRKIRPQVSITRHARAVSGSWSA